MLARYPFAGVLNLDDPESVFPTGHHRMARNGIFRGTAGRMRFENSLGTNLVPNSFLPGTGVNKTIGVHYDAVNQRVFFFNFNSAGNNGIYIYYTLLKSFQRLIQSGINTDGDVLGFTASGRISSIDIIYGDGVNGDLLFWVDSLLRPSKANINRLLANTYITIKRTYLDVIKAPPIPPPQCTYENDPTVTNNNVINALFNFSCTHIYDDFEQSVLGSGARQALPPDPFDPQNNTPATRCARIAIYVPTGDQNVTKIRIYGKQTKDGNTTDWFVIDTLIKADLGIANNTVYKYLFFNNGNYVPADPNFTVLDYDVVPQAANAQGLLDGNVIAYGGITEGYDFLNPSFSIVTSNGNEPAYTLNGTLFFANYNGIFTGNQPQITFYLTGVGTNDGFNNPITLEKAPNLLIVSAQSNATAIGTVYVNSGMSNSIPTILAAFQAQLQSGGWVFVSNPNPNSLTMYYPTGNIVLQSAYLNSEATDTSPYLSPVSCHYPESAYSYGVVYRDYAGRTNGVISNVTGNIKTQARGSANQIPIVTISMAGFVPPVWATYYEVVRTDTLTYQKYFDWVSDSAYQGVGQGVSTQYGYFGINNILTYNTSINATEGVVSYAFSQGDRIKILGRYDAAGNFTALNLDYAILGVATNPVVNGTVMTGSFIQIYYPSGDIGPNFQFPTTPNDTNFQNYSILIYSYKALSAANQNVYFQIGQQYGIMNAGTNFAAHMGNDPTSLNVVIVSDGDVFYRQRNVSIQSSYFINTGSFDQTSPYGTDWINPGGGAIPIVDNGIWKIVGGVQKVAGLLPTQYPTYTDNDFTILNESSTIPLTIRLRGTQTIVDKTDPNGQYSKFVKIVQPGNVVTTNQIVPLQTGMQPGVSVTVTFDSTIILPPLGKLWLINHCINEMLIGGYLLELDVIRTRTINVFDSSFSDIYALRTNSDNKPNVINVEARTTYFSTLFRYSQPDQLGTDINNSNRFYPNNFDEFDKSYGDIIRLRVRQREMRVFQKRRCGRVGVYQKFISNEASNTSLIVSDTIITPNNIQYYEGEWGIGNQPDSLCSSGYADYFADPVKGFICRLSEDGIIPISELYKAQTWAGTNLPAFLNSFPYQFGGNAVIISAFNFLADRDSEALFFLQGGASTAAGPIPAQGLAFVERDNAFRYFLDFAPDSAVCAENLMIYFYNGLLYTFDNSTTYANYFGVQQVPTVTVPYKDPIIEKKTFLAVEEVSNVPWSCPTITTDTFSYPGTPQLSNLVVEDFVSLGTNWYAAFWNDVNSIGSLIDGDVLQGTILNIQFNTSTPAGFSVLTEVGIRYIDSPLTAK